MEVYNILNLTYIRLLKILWNMSMTKLSMHDKKVLNKGLQIPSKILTVSTITYFLYVLMNVTDHQAHISIRALWQK